MLTFMRAFAKSKIAVGILFLLVIGFLLTGATDLFKGGSRDGTFVRAGSIYAGQPHFALELDRIRNGYSQQANREVSRQEIAASPQVIAGITTSLQNRITLLAYADQIGFRFPDEVAVREFKDVPIFANDLGGIDTTKMARWASDNGFASLNDLNVYGRENVTALYMQRAAVGGLHPPQILIRQFTDLLAEQRTISLATVDPAKLPAVAAPAEPVLRQYYQANLVRYSLPEMRSFSVVQYSPMDFVGKVNVTDLQIQQDYQRRIREFSGPETRQIAVVTAATRPPVQAVVDLVARNVPLADAVRQTAGVSLETKSVQPGFTDVAEVNEGVFGLQQNVMSGIVQFEGKFTSFRVTGITPGAARPLDEFLRSSIAMDVAFPEARRAYEALTESISDLAASGVDLKQIADAANAPIIQLPPITAGGVDRDGHPSLLFRPYASQKPDYSQTTTLPAAFALGQGAPPLVVSAEYCPEPSQPTRPNCRSRLVVRFDGVEAPRTRPFEEVRERVLEDWRREQQTDAVNRMVEQVIARVRGGQTLEAAARAANMNFMAIPQPLDRSGSSGLDQQTVNTVFQMHEGDAISVKIGGGPMPSIFQLVRINRIDPTADPRIAAQSNNYIRQSLERDLIGSLLAGAASKVKVTVNQPAIEEHARSIAGVEAPTPQ